MRIDNLSRPISVKEIESIINNLPKQKAPAPVGEPDEFSGEFYQTFKEELIPILCDLFQKIEAQGTRPNSSYETSITPIQTQKKILQEKKTTDQYFSRT